MGESVMARILAVDPGEVRIGLAISDPTGTIARPLKVIRHTARHQDAEAILAEAEAQEANTIVVGLALDMEGEIGPQARRAMRLVDVLRSLTDRRIDTWDESGSTQAAGRGFADLDARAAAVILQEYLDDQESKT
jgi:putative Holliday junction resolvase